MDHQIENIPFEEALGKLESLVESLEKGQTPLEELVAKFSEGTKLLQVCERRLSEAEMKIEKLQLEAGNISTVPFEVNPASS